MDHLTEEGIESRLHLYIFSMDGDFLLQILQPVPGVLGLEKHSMGIKIRHKSFHIPN